MTEVLRTVEVSRHREIVEQARGVLMLRYGVGSYVALATLARWAREAEVDINEISRVLVHGVCQGRIGPHGQDRGLVRWLEHQLRTEISDRPQEERWDADE